MISCFVSYSVALIFRQAPTDSRSILPFWHVLLSSSGGLLKKQFPLFGKGMSGFIIRVCYNKVDLDRNPARERSFPFVLRDVLIEPHKNHIKPSIRIMR